jgi:NADPH-dependent curcumin reductase CurA
VPSDWEWREEAVPSPGSGEFLVRVRLISLDPAMRGWMNAGRSYLPPVGVGEVMRALGGGEVVVSRHPDFSAGDHVTGNFGVQDFAVSDGSGVFRVSLEVAPLPMYLSVLGVTGLTAYFGLLEIGRPHPGETVVVSAAAGAVGMVVGQIAKIKGCRVVGIAGGPEKCRFIVDDLGFDAAIDYKHEDVRAALRERCPDRVDVYFDNVGGEILDAVLTRLARHARIVICGSISQYNNEGPARGPANYMALLVDRARMEGFLVFDYASRYREAAAQMAGWVAEGRLLSVEDIVTGLESFPETLLRLYRGENLGKLLLAVED